MMTELILVEGVSDVQLISYYLQNVYGWKHERENILGIEPLDEHEHIESLSKNAIQDSFGQAKSIYTYLLIIPANEKGALERVIIDALNDIPEETALMGEVEQFIDALKAGLVPDLNQINNANKATVGTFFSVRYPKKALRSFGVFISKIDWSKSVSLNQLFLPFQCLGEDKPLEN